MSSRAKKVDELLKRERVGDIISSMSARDTTGNEYPGRVLQKVLVSPEQNIPDEFVVGYGLDYDGLYRNLPCIGVLSPDIIARREGRV